VIGKRGVVIDGDTERAGWHIPFANPAIHGVAQSPREVRQHIPAKRNLRRPARDDRGKHQPGFLGDVIEFPQALAAGGGKWWFDPPRYAHELGFEGSVEGIAGGPVAILRPHRYRMKGALECGQDIVIDPNQGQQGWRCATDGRSKRMAKSFRHLNCRSSADPANSPHGAGGCIE
jgi:hypothetical protein